MYQIRFILLFPLGIVWGIMASMKRFVFEKFNLRITPIVNTCVIGNIEAGGVGKTPMVIALSNLFKSSDLPFAVLSRGYARQTKGFAYLTSTSTTNEVGDEPLEIFCANEHIGISAVCEDRIIGINRLKADNPQIQLVLLDDGFQHIRLRAKSNILLTSFHSPFTKNFPLPAGNLREWPTAIKSANAIIVTQCPKNLTIEQSLQWKITFTNSSKKWNLGTVSHFDCLNHIYFAYYKTTTPYCPITKESLSTDCNIILVTGIANSDRVIKGLDEYAILKHFKYPDHHSFSIDEFLQWKKFINGKTVLVTTRKDYQRLLFNQKKFKLDQIPFYVVHTEVEFLFDCISNIKEIITPKNLC